MALQRLFALTTICGLGLLVTAPRPADASDIGPGYDLYRTLPSSYLEFGAGAIPIPADFFDPGSDPFTGTVNFHGTPIGPGNTDTIVQRLGPISPFPVGGSGTVPIEIVELNLVSVAPIVVTYNGGQNPETWQINISLLGPQAPGGLVVNHEAPLGGTDGGPPSDLPIICQALFQRLVPHAPVYQPLPLELLLYQDTWSHAPLPNDQHNFTLPAGQFYSGGINGILHLNGANGPSVGELHGVAATPEPAVAGVVLMGSAMLLRRRRQRIMGAMI